jgi:type III secretory pathway component EscU
MGNLLHLWRTSAEFRFVTGFIWGVILAFYLVVGIIDLSFKLWKRKPVA